MPLVSRKFFAVGPGCAKCFFLLRPVGRRDLSAGPEQQKKKRHPGCFFLLRPRRKAGEGEAPLGAGTGPEQKKKHHPQGVFLAAAPAKGRGRRSHVGRRHGPEPKKNPPRVFFFGCGPGERQGKEKPRWTPRPFGGARSKKNHDPGCFFWSGPAGWQGKEKD